MLPARGRSQPANSLPAAVCPSVCKRCPDYARVLTQARPDVLPCWQPPGALAGPRPCSRLGTFWMKHWPRVRHTTLQHTYAASPGVASGALGTTGTPRPSAGRCHCKHMAAELLAGPGLVAHRPHSRNEAPPACPPSSSRKAAPASLQCTSLASGAASAAAQCRGRARAWHGTPRASGQTSQSAEPRGAPEVSSPCCSCSTLRLRGRGFTRSTGHRAGAGKPLPCGPRQLRHRPAL